MLCPEPRPVITPPAKLLPPCFSHLGVQALACTLLLTITVYTVMVPRTSQLCCHKNTPSVHSSVPSRTASAPSSTSNWTTCITTAARAHPLILHLKHLHIPVGVVHHKPLLYTDPHCAVSYTHPNPRQQQSKPIVTHAVIPRQMLLPHTLHPHHQLQTWTLAECPVTVPLHPRQIYLITFTYTSPSRQRLLSSYVIIQCRVCPYVFAHNHLASFQIPPPPAHSVLARRGYSPVHAPCLHQGSFST